MVPTFDIFRVESDGHLVWRSAADDLDTAQRRVRILMASEPGDYVIYNQKTGRARLIDFELVHDRSLSAKSRHADDLLVFLLDILAK